jgi:hypothetical protein
VRFAVDWDGTCVPHRFPEQPREWLPGAVAALRKLSSVGEVVIFSCRVARFQFGNEQTLRNPAQVQVERNYIRSMLDAEGLWDITLWLKDYKPPAVAYVDDKAVHYNGRPGAWDALVPKLLIMAGLEPVFETLEEGGIASD